jgi:hypothetical protein
VPAPRDRIERLYRRIQSTQAAGLRASALPGLFAETFDACLAALSAYPRVPLTTNVPGKTYFAFESPKGKISRAVNDALYIPDPQSWMKLVAALRDGDFTSFGEDDLTRTIYTVAMSFFVLIDLTRTGDQKTPGTFFEYLIGHLFASRLGVDPTTRLPVLNLDMNTTLPTDYIFDLGQGRPKFHLPIKTSTRERVIQVWAHQRMLDGVYGTGRFLGTPVVLAETKTDRRKRKVVEICLPLQWRLYQMHISQLRRFYYLDMPIAYSALTTVFPPIHVVPFGHFFIEADELSAV